MYDMQICDLRIIETLILDYDKPYSLIIVIFSLNC